MIKLISGRSVSATLTGTSIAWNSTIDGKTVEFGVSGLLFRNNLIPYDRETDTHYSQMQMRGVEGSLKGEQLEAFQVFQTTWSTWKQMFPDARVLTTETGYNRSYSGYLYGEDYLEEDSPPLFPLSIELGEKVVKTYKKRQYLLSKKMITLISPVQKYTPLKISVRMLILKKLK